MPRPSRKIQPRIFNAVSISNTFYSSVHERTDVNVAGGSVLDDHNPPRWVTFACRFTLIARGGSSRSRIGKVPDHLMPATVPLLQADDAVRIAHVRAPRWISHPAAGAAHDAMRLLLERPPSLRARGLLLAGPYHNGKTMIAERFAVEHLRAADQQKVWVIQTREGAGLSHFYASILSGLRAPQAAGWRSLSRAGDQFDHLLERLKPRLLIFDEFHSALRGRRQDVKAIFSFLRRIARVHDISRLDPKP